MVNLVRGTFVLLLSVVSASTISIAKSSSSSKSILVTAPIIKLTREARGRVEFNLLKKGSIAFEGSYLPPGEELRGSEIEDHPGDSMITSGREYKLMVARYSSGEKMGGWYWGLGVGQRSIQANWTKDPYGLADEQFGLEDENGKINNQVNIVGTSLEGRAGYRYVAPELGFLIGFYIGIRHYQNKVTNADAVELSVDDDSLVEIHEHDSNSLSRRLTSRLVPDIEIGWAF